MSRRSRHSNRDKRSPDRHQRRLACVICAGLLGLLVVLSLADTLMLRGTGKGRPAQAFNLPDLLHSEPASLVASDLALMNLACAQGLPGAEDLDPQACLATLDLWAQHVRSETERHLYRFRSHPQEFENSEAYFRMLLMAVTLCEDFRIRYNPQQIAAAPVNESDYSFFADSRDLFLHGLCGSRRTGTCSSMPVLYAAIGRRLGYPLKLATTKAHLFLRWDGTGERFNLEATGRGMNRYDDDHYRNWPFPVSEAEIEEGGYLKSLSPDEEAALFLSLRGNCLRHTGRLHEALAAYGAATRLAPHCLGYRLLLLTATQSGSLPLQPDPAAAAYGPPDPNPLSRIRLPTY